MKHIIPVLLKQFIALDEFNEKSMSEIDNRDDGAVEVIEVNLIIVKQKKNWCEKKKTKKMRRLK